MTNRTDTWTYASMNSVTTSGDMTDTYYTGLKTTITQTTVKYFRIESATYSAGSDLTTIVLNGFGLYTVANAPITSHSDMVAENPVGFPLAFEGSGRSGGQTITGGTASGDDLTLRSTSHATKGSIVFGTSVYDEVNNRLGICRTPATYPFEVQGDIYATGTIHGATDSNLGSYDSIVYVSGSTVIAKNALGATIDSGTHNTDDSNVIQTAINAGGAVLLAHASFTLEAPLEITTSGVRLYSNSRSVTLTAKNSLNDNMIEITGTGVCKATLSNLILDGNKANQASGNAIYISTPYSSKDANHLLQSLHIKNTKADGIVIAGDTRCCKFDHIVIMDGDGTGYTLAGSDHILNDASTGACKTGGFNISAGSIKAVTCKAFYCGQTSGVGIYVTGDRGTYIGCEAQDNYSSGWMLDGADNCLLTNCVGDSNGTTTDWQSGIVIHNSNNNIITSGAFFDRQVTATQHWGVHITGTSTGCVVTYPSYSGNVTDTYYDESSGTNYEVLPA